MYELVEPLTGALIVGAQALAASIIGEALSIQGGKHGFRDQEGEFQSKGHGILRVFFGVIAIAVVVQFLPAVLNAVFPSIAIQTLGLGFLLSVILVNIAVDRWKMGIHALSLHLSARARNTLAEVTGIVDSVDVPTVTMSNFDYRTVTINLLGLLLIVSGYVFAFAP